MYEEKPVSSADTHARKCSYRMLALIMAMVLVVGSAVGGTVAWLIAKTEPVVNTFTYGDIDLKLEETKVDENGSAVDEDGDSKPDKTTGGNEYEMIPGKEYLKDPTVTVLEGSEACWLFVKLEEKGGVTITNDDGSTTPYDFDDYLNYEIADGWTQLKGEDGNLMEGIYYRQVDEDTDDIAVYYGVLKDDKITVLSTVNKDMLNALDNNGQDAERATYPSLSVTAYAVQYSGFEPEISEDATAPTPEQLNSAALAAWKAVETQTTENL